MALERVLRHALGGSLLAIGLSILGSACTRQQQAEQAQRQTAALSSFRTQLKRSIFATTYLRVAIINSSDLAAIASWPSESLVLREAGAKLASEATRPDALGVYGIGTTAEEDFDGVIVADDLVASNVAGQYEATIYAIIPGSVHIKGFHVTEVQLGYTSTTSTAPSCDPLLRGCHPKFTSGPHAFSSTLDTGAGLPETIIINAETGITTPNASGTIPELWLRPPSRMSTTVTNPFICYGAVAVDAKCAKNVSGASRFPAGVSYWSADTNLRIISETDYFRLIKESPPSTTVTPLYLRSQIVPLATISNWSGAVGARGTKMDGALNGNPVIVARDIVDIGNNHIETTSYYIATDILTGSANIWGNVSVGYSGNLPEFDWKQGPCGAITLPTETYCSLPVCLNDKYTPTFYDNPGLGMDRWPMATRTTIHSNDIWSVARTPNLFACSPIVRPWDNLLNKCGQTPGMALNAEVCNGVDDNCNGKIDEEGVCTACNYEIEQ